MEVRINPLVDDLKLPGEAARLLSRQVSPSTVHRWIARGVQGVKLPAVRIGRRVYTTQEALSWFVDETTRRAEEERDRESEAVQRRRRLQEAGLL